MTENRPGSQKVSAVIVHYRAPDHTVASARAVAQTAPGTEVVVVDNASGDAIGERLAAEVPQARLFVEAKNRGYGAGCNRGARETSRPLLLFLNSDAVVFPGAVGTLVAALDADPAAAAAGPRLSTPMEVFNIRSSGSRRRGGSSARARAWRPFQAAAGSCEAIRRPARITSGAASCRH